MFAELESKIESLFMALYEATPEPTAKASLKTKNNKYRVVSSMQKAIRRGHTKMALRCAAALCNSGEADYMFRRLAVTALEDICFGDGLASSKMLMWCLGKKKLRANLGNMRIAFALINFMTASVKNRAACNISVASCFAPDKTSMKWDLMDTPREDLAAAFLDAGNILEYRVLAGWALGGSLSMTKPGEGRTYPETSPKMYMAVVEALTDDIEILYLNRKGLTYGGELHGLGTSLIFANDQYQTDKDMTMVDILDLPEPELISGIANYAYDMHTREGKRAIAYMAKTNLVIRDYCHPYNVSPFEFICYYTFLVETCLVTPHLMYPADTHMRIEHDRGMSQKAGMPDNQLDVGKTIMLEQLPALDAARRRIME